MKNSLPLFIAIASAFSISCFAQRGVSGPANPRMEDAQLMADASGNDEPVVVAYHVVEKINMNFGSQVTSYNVPSLSQVSTNDLGPNNTRVVTPIYGKIKARAKTDVLSAMTTGIAATDNLKPKAVTEIVVPAQITKAVAEVPAKKETGGYVNIDIISTYERILDKGYKSVDMLKRVGNSRFFDGDLVIAAKWYEKLFALTNDLEPVYYYRYAQALKSIKQVQKSDEMMAIFERKNL